MLGLLFPFLVGACAPSTAFEVEGKALAPESWSAQECDPVARCIAIEEVARAQLMAREPNVVIVETRFHAPRQGTVVASMEQVNVVFELADGSFRLESFACGPHGIVDASQEAYADFCDRPAE